MYIRSKTQKCHITNYLGPSGQRYESLEGHSFIVKNKEDQEFFLTGTNERRFEKVGILEDKVIPKKDVDELLMDDLKRVGAISDETRTNIVRIFHSKKALIDAVRSSLTSGTSLSPLIPENHDKTIKDWITQEEKEVDKTPDRTKEEIKKGQKETSKIVKKIEEKSTSKKKRGK